MIIYILYTLYIPVCGTPNSPYLTRLPCFRVLLLRADFSAMAPLWYFLVLKVLKVLRDSLHVSITWLLIGPCMSTFQFQVGMPMRWKNLGGVQSVLMPQVTLRAATIPASWPLNLPGWAALFEFQRFFRPASCVCVRKEDGTIIECINGCFGTTSPSLTEPHGASQRQQEPLAAGQSGWRPGGGRSMGISGSN